MSVFDAMRRYVDSADRTSPLVFVGRQRELERLDATIRNVAECGTEGATSVVYGVPGAGKTALARELANRWVQREADGRPVCVVRLGVGALDASPRELAATLLRHLPLRSQLPQGSLGLAENSGLSDCLDAYGALWLADVTIVLAVDEFQAVPVTPRSRALVRELHENIGNHRIVLLAFGLQNAVDVLCAEDGLNLSRLKASAGIPLGTLEPGQGREAIAGTLDALGLRWGNKEWRDYLRQRGFEREQWQRWAERLVSVLDRETANFPHHLTNALAAVCDCLLRGQSTFSPEHDLVDAVLAKLNSLKGAYYDTRLGQLRDHSLALGALCSQMLERDLRIVLKAEARDALATSTNDGDRVKPKAAAELLARAIGRGIFTPEAGGLAVTIPSMITHLAHAFEAQAGNGDQIALSIRAGVDVSKSAARYGNSV